MTTDEAVEKFALVCDAIERIFYAEEDGIEPYEIDGLGHTSTEARKAALAVFEALGILE
jgi:hypothetical protein